MIKKILLLSIVSVLLVGCIKPKTKTMTKETTNDTSTTMETTALSPSKVIDSYMKATLGMIPGADIDYDHARTLMTTSYAAEFTDSMFVPTSYGMQDGPDSVEITDEEILTDTATVTVLGHWGPDNQMYWMFELEKEAGDWKLNFINPGQ
jgi:hypothetical protein